MNEAEVASRRREALRLVRAGELSAAAPLLGRLTEVLPDDAAAHTAHATVLMRLERWEEASEAALRAALLSPEDAALAVRAINLLLRCGRTAAAYDLALGAAARHPEVLRIQALALQASVARRDPGAELLAESAIRLAPGDPAILRMAGRVYGLAGRWADAAPVLQKAVELKPDPLALAWLAEALEKTERSAAAADVYAALTRLTPENARAWSKLAEAQWRAGARSDAARAFRRGVSLRERTLPDSFATGLANLWGQTETIDLPEARLAWAYGVQAGAAPGAEAPDEGWRRAARWGALATRFVNTWMEVSPERIGEIADLAELGGLDRLHQARNGAFVATAHLGPSTAIAAALERHGLEFRWVGALAPFPEGPVHARLISSTYPSGRSSAIAAIHEALSAGRVVTAAMDLDPNRAPKTLFHGRRIAVSETAALMVHWLGAEPLFLDARWDGGRIVFDLVPMPTPHADETSDDYVARWTEDYLAKMEAVIRSGPVNLCGSGGLWNHVG